MGRRLHNPGLSVVLACALMGCAAPAPQSTQESTTVATQQAARTQSAPVQSPSATTPDLRKLKPRTGGPLPPQVLGEPVKIDRSCSSDADCAVKNVGNCCGVAPACVNVNSPTDPKAVQAECAKKGMASICGFKPIDHCQCVEGQCRAELITFEVQ